jgi:hypothetical protein
MGWQLGQLPSTSERSLNLTGMEGSPRRAQHAFTIRSPRCDVEGIAAGEFFGSDATISSPSDLAAIALTAVCLDVGGGTTDISVWGRYRIRLDASIRLAGRQVSAMLQQQPRLLELMFSRTAADALAETQDSPTAFAARLNVILSNREEEDAIRDGLSKNAKTPEVQWLRRMLALEFGAIAFYAAALVGAADRDTASEVLANVRESGVKLHWGGNAAKMISWIDLGRSVSDSVAALILNAMVFNGLDDIGVKVAAAKLGQPQSPGYKSEVAGGLVVMDWERRDDDRAWNGSDDDDNGLSVGTDEEEAARALGSGQVCGETIELEGGRQVTFTDALTERDLFEHGKTKFKSTSLDRLRKFVRILNTIGVKRGLLTDDTKIDLERHADAIKSAIRASFIRAESRPEGRRVLEPIFIMEVRELMARLRDIR